MIRPTSPTSELILVDDHLALVFPYDKEQVTEVKSIPGARWDRLARVWRVPLARIEEARAFARRHGFHVDDDLDRFEVPQRAHVPTGIRVDDEWIWFDFAYDPVRVREVKHVPGVTWDRTTKAWRAPRASLAEALDFARNFGESIPPEMLALAEEMRVEQDRFVVASRAVDADFKVAGLPLLAYQRAGVAYASTSRRCLLADDMGLGKTLQAIATLEHLHLDGTSAYPAVVVCPPSLVLNWAAEYARWLPERTVVTVTNRKEFPDPGYDVVVLGYSNLHHWANQLRGHRSLVLDESHYCKTLTAQRTKAAIKVAKTVPPEGVVLGLTGTPITNRPAEYAAQLQVLGKLDDFGGLHGFWRRYCAGFKDRWGQWNVAGASHLDELNERLRATGTYIRRTKAEVLAELPPVLHDPVHVEGTPAGLREYAKAEADIVEYLVERARQIALDLGVKPGSAMVRARMAAESAEHLVRLAVLRKLAARAKMDFVHEWVEAHVAAGRKVVLAAHHREIVDELAHAWGGLKIQGGMTVEAVEVAKSRFQGEDAETAPVMVLSIQAAKTGHTLTAAQDIAFVELPFTPSDLDQTYSRLHRLGQHGSVTATYLLCAGTIDEDLYDLIAQKRAVVDAATEGGVGEDAATTERLLRRFWERPD